jgi:NADH-quinone oxidoreductase subunit G
MNVKVKIDDKEYEVPKGARLIDVCEDVGIKIPHFCYHRGLGHDGNCRMCQVELITPRGPMLAISCNTYVTDGMEVVTNSEKVLKTRAAVEEFLLLDHPLDCPICDKAGECTLQDYYYEHDLQDSRMKFPRQKKGKAIILGDTLILDRERCVLCNRCVRFLRDIAGDEELFIAGRGHNSYITAFPGKTVDSPYSLNTVDLCPVGALTSRDFRFSSPTWMLTRSPSVCTTCARGCNIFVDHRDGKVHRLRPRHNDDVNKYWMCDEGRLNFRYVNDERVTAFEIRRDGSPLAAPAETALKEIVSILRPASSASGGGAASTPAPEGGDIASATAGGAAASSTFGGDTPSVTILASLNCTLEEMFLLKKIAGMLGNAGLFAVRHIPDGEEDNILRRADRHANAKSAELLGIPVLDLRDETGKSEIGQQVSQNTIIMAAGFDRGISALLSDLVSRAGASIMIAACRSRLLDGASVVVPGLTFAEKEGLIINCEGHVQRLLPALAPQGDASDEWRFLSQLLAALSEGEGYKSIADMRGAIGKEEAAFAKDDLVSIRLSGLRLEASAEK